MDGSFTVVEDLLLRQAVLPETVQQLLAGVKGRIGLLAYHLNGKPPPAVIGPGGGDQQLSVQGNAALVWPHDPAEELGQSGLSDAAGTVHAHDLPVGD